MGLFNTGPWTLDRAAGLCRELENIAPAYGAHVALTGGCLYKDGGRKDVDIHLYRIRQINDIDWEGFFLAIKNAYGIRLVKDHGWCKKAVTRYGDKIDFFDAEDKGGDYGVHGELALANQDE